MTHLPQIAALGDVHFAVAKQVADGRTRTLVTPLSGDERAEELSQMLGGARTEASQANACDLLERANAWKQERAPAAAPA